MCGIKIRDFLPHKKVTDLLDIIFKKDDNGNIIYKEEERADVIIRYAKEHLKEIIAIMEKQFSDANCTLSKATKEDIIIAIIAQHMAEHMQYRYNSEMDKKAVAVTMDTANRAGVSGYKDKVSVIGYNRDKTATELGSEKKSFKQYLEKQICEETKNNLVKCSHKDNGNKGFFYCSHAERELSHRTTRPIGVSKRMCNECVNYFRNLPSQRIVADPDFIWIFEKNGSIKVFTNNAGQKQLKAKMRNFYKKYGAI